MAALSAKRRGGVNIEYRRRERGSGWRNVAAWRRGAAAAMARRRRAGGKIENQRQA